jgi:hypothetical protein
MWDMAGVMINTICDISNEVCKGEICLSVFSSD